MKIAIPYNFNPENPDKWNTPLGVGNRVDRIIEVFNIHTNN